MPSIHAEKHSFKKNSIVMFIKNIDFFTVLRYVVGLFFVFSLVFVPHVSFLQSYAVTLGTSLVGLALVFGILFQKKIDIPQTPAMYGLLAFLVAVIMSAIFSPQAKALSFIGFGGELDTVIFVTTWVLLIVTVSAITNSARSLFNFFKMITIASAALVLLFSIQEIFFAQKFFMYIP